MISSIISIIFFLAVFIVILEIGSMIFKADKLSRPHGGMKKCYKEYKQTKNRRG